MCEISAVNILDTQPRSKIPLQCNNIFLRRLCLISIYVYVYVVPPTCLITGPRLFPLLADSRLFIWFLRSPRLLERKYAHGLPVCLFMFDSWTGQLSVTVYVARALMTAYEQPDLLPVVLNLAITRILEFRMPGTRRGHHTPEQKYTISSESEKTSRSLVISLRDPIVCIWSGARYAVL